VLHEVLDGRHLTKVEFQHELPKLQDRLLDARSCCTRRLRLAVIVTASRRRRGRQRSCRFQF
jgi:hypothetical protein